jgi:RNA polymerase sigma-70 factor, ECF subfamily
MLRPILGSRRSTSSSRSQSVTELLLAWSEGEQSALEQLMPYVYDDLRSTARRYMRRERPDHTLQATALVNETYARLVDIRRIRWQDRAHFLAMAARLMRRILVEFARARGYQKRGGARNRVPLTESLCAADAPSYDVLALDEALDRLASMDCRRGQIVELRFFGGLTIEETAAALQISSDTVVRDWKLAKSWLAREMKRRS